MKTVLSILACITAWISSSGLLQAQAGESPLRTAERLAISITGVPGHRQAAQSFIVSNDGTVTLTYLSEGVRAVGLTPRALAREIERAYKAAGIFTKPSVNVQRIVEGGPLVVTVAGNVGRPGPYVFRPGMRISDAIAECGAFNDSANPRRVRLKRRGTTKEIDMRNISSHPENNLLLEPGDEIFVPDGSTGR